MRPSRDNLTEFMTRMQGGKTRPWTLGNMDEKRMGVRHRQTAFPRLANWRWLGISYTQLGPKDVDYCWMRDLQAIARCLQHLMFKPDRDLSPTLSSIFTR